MMETFVGFIALFLVIAIIIDHELEMNRIEKNYRIWKEQFNNLFKKEEAGIK